MDQSQQPYIIELCMISGSNVLQSMVRPPIPISEEITKITGIRPEDVVGAPTFGQLYKRIAAFCLGAETWVAHNIEFDANVMWDELTRIGMERRFPWPLEYCCTLERARLLPPDQRPAKNTLSALYEHVTGNKLEGAHRAEVDVRALIEVYDWLLDK